MHFIKQEPLSLAPGNEPGGDRESGLEYSSISISWSTRDVQEDLQLLGMTMKTSSHQRGDSLVEVWWSGRTLEGVDNSIWDVRRVSRECQVANMWLGLVSCLENTGNLPCSQSFFRLLKCWKAPGSHYWTNCSSLQINEGQFQRNSCASYSTVPNSKHTHTQSIDLALFSFKWGLQNFHRPWAHGRMRVSGLTQERVTPMNHVWILQFSLWDSLKRKQLLWDLGEQENIL